MSGFFQMTFPVQKLLCSMLLCLPGLVMGAGAGAVGGSAVLLPVSAVGLAPALSPSKIIPMSDSFPGMAAIAADAHIPSSLPGLPQAAVPAATFAGIIHEIAERQGAMLTQQGVATTLRGVEVEGIASLGGNLAQSAIDAGLRHIEAQAVKQHLVRNLNLSWAPGFNGREDLYQIDMLLSLVDGQRSSLMTQLGLQRRDGETGLNAGMVLRTQSFEHWILGLNVFYDYLSEPEVDRWSAGMELKSRWLGFSSNIYMGLDEDASGSEVMYSPDGWDVELSGHVPELPWLEYSGKYYKWEGNQGDDLKGQEYKLTLRPVPMFDISLRYDSVQSGDDGFGIETQLKYEFGRPISEQLSYSEVATPADPWARRFERVRREYEQRVQRRGASTSVRVTGSTVMATVASVPVDATQVVVTGTVRNGNTLTRAARAVSAAAVRIHGGNCHVEGIIGASCTFTVATREIMIINLAPGDYSFSASFQDVDGNVVGSPVQFAATIMAVAGPTASIAVSPAAIAEDGGSTMVTVTISAAQPNEIVVTLTRTGMATLGTDYTLAGLTELTDPNYTLTVPANATMATFMLTAVDDSDDDDSEAAVFTIAPGAGYTPGTGGAEVVTITVLDDDGVMDTSPPGSVTGLTAMAGNAQVELSWTNPADTDLAMVLISATASGGAVDINGSAAGTDLSIVVTPNSAGSQTITTGLSNNIMYTFSVVAVDHLANASLATIAMATPTVVVPQFSFQTATATVVEGGVVIVNIDYTGGELESSVNLNISLNGSTAVEAADYTTTNGNAAFTSGFINVLPRRATPAHFTIRTTADIDGEGSENLVITLQRGTGYTVGSQNTYTLTITDAPPAVRLAVSSTTIAEADTSSTTVTVTLSAAAPPGGVTVNLTRSGNATIGAGNDYTASSSLNGSGTAYMLTVPVNATTASFTLTAVDDSDDDDNETVTFMVTTGTGYTIGIPATVTVTITDDDGAPVPATPTASLAVSSATIAEADTSSATVTVTLSQMQASPVTVNIMQGGSATIATDYTVGGLSGTNPNYMLMVPANTVTATFTLMAVDDSDDDDNETVTFMVTTGTGYTIGIPATVTVTITDDDGAPVPATPTASLAVSSATIAEADTSSATVTVTLSQMQASPVTVNIMQGGSATIATDYTVGGLSGTNPNYMLMVPANTVTATFTLMAVDDSDDDDNETVTFMVTTGTGYAIGTTAAVTVTITDDDGTPAPVTPTASLAVSSATIAEADTSSTTVTVTLSAAAPVGGVTVNLTRSGSATIVTDYTVGSLSGTDPTYSIMIAGSATTASFTLTAVDDSDDDNSETVTFMVTTGTGYTIGTTAAVTVTITDDDGTPAPVTPTASLAVSSTTIAEADTSSTTVTVTLSAAAPVGGVTVNLTRSGSATIVTDYTVGSLSGTDPTYSIMIAGSATTASFTLTAVDDSDDDDNETVTFTLTTGTGYTIGTTAAVTVTITDDDDAAGSGPEFSFQTATATVDEGDSPMVEIDFTGSGLVGAVAVGVSLGGTAVAADYSASGFNSGAEPSFSGTPTISITGSTPATFFITTAMDSVIELDETLIITLLPGTGYTVDSSKNTYTLTIVDLTAPDLVSNVNSSESAAGQITLTWTNPSSVNLAMVRIEGRANDMLFDINGEATAGDDITLPATPGSTGNQIITGLSPGIQYGFRIYAVSSAGVESSANRDPTISNIRPTASVYINTAGTQVGSIAEEGATSITVTVALNVATGSIVQFTLSGSATFGAAMDYTYSSELSGNGPTRLITIAEGNTTASFTLTAVDDSVDDDDETVTFTVAASGSLAIPTDGSETVTVTITDNDGTPAPVTPTASLAVSSTTIAEADTSSTTVTVTLSAAAPVGGVTVNLTRSGNADIGAGNDYTASSSLSGTDPTYSIMIAGSATTASFTLTAVDDSVDDDDETAIFTLTTGSGYTIGTTAAVTVTITDDDGTPAPVTPTASLAVDTTAIAEAGGIATVTVTLNPAPTTAVTVNLTRSGNADIGAGNDYTAGGISGGGSAFRIIVAAGATTASFTLTAVDDSVDDDDETAIFTLTTGTGYTPATGGAEAVTVTITDNDDAAAAGPEFSFQTATATVNEGASPMVEIDFTGSGLVGAVAVGVSLTGTAVAADYSASGFNSGAEPSFSGTPTISITGSTPATFLITTAMDSVIELDETLIITLLPGTGYTVDSSKNTYTLTIVDLTAPDLVSNVNSSESAAGQITLTWTNPSSANLAMVRIEGSADGVQFDINGEATAGDDITLPATPGSSGSQIITGLSPGIQYGFRIYAVSSAGVESSANRDPTISNIRPTASVYINTAGTQVGSIAEDGATSITVTVALNVTTGSIVQFTLSGSATFGAAMDYTLSSELSGNGPTRLIMIAEGNTTASFTLTAVDDSVDDDDETVTFTVAASGSLAIPTDGSETVTVTITDNDSPSPLRAIPTASLAVSSATIAEADTSSATVTVTLSAAAPAGGVTVNLASSGSAAIGAGMDYTAGGLSGGSSSYSIMIAESATTASFTLTAVDDSVDDDDETAIFTLTTGTGYTPATGGAEAVTVTITDNDDAAAAGPEFSFPTATATVNEGAFPMVEIDFTGSGLVGAVAVGVSLTGTAVAADYSASGFNTGAEPSFAASTPTISFTTGPSPASFFITTATDSVIELDETLIITLLPGTGYTVDSSKNTYTLTIVDSTAPDLVSNVNSSESAAGQITLTWTNPSSANLAMVRIEGRADGVLFDINGDDMGNDITLPATPGSSGSQIITGLSPGIQYGFRIYAVSSAGVESSANRDPTISNIRPTASVYINTAGTQVGSIAEEGATSITVTVALNVATGSIVQFTLSGSATFGAAMDYTYSSELSGNGPTRLIMIAEGNTTASFTLTAVDDSVDDDDETVTFTVAASGSLAIPTDGSETVTVTITDNDSPSPLRAIPTASLAVSSTTIAEADTSSTTVTVTLSAAAPVGGVTVNLASSGSAAIGAGMDYTAGGLSGGSSSYSIMIAESATTASFTLTAVDDSVDDDSETATFMVTTGTGYTPATGGAEAVTVTITDNDDAAGSGPEFSFPTATATVNEMGGFSTVEIDFTGSGLVGAVAVGVSLTGTAAAADYSASGFNAGAEPSFAASTPTISFTTGSSPASFFITTAMDSVIELDETLIITLLPGTGYTVDSSKNTYTLTIVDSTAPDLVSNVNSSESAAGQITLTWTNPSSVNLAMVRIEGMANDMLFDINGDDMGNDITLPATPGSSGSQIITGLSPGIQYGFRIYAVSSAGVESSANRDPTISNIRPTASVYINTAGTQVGSIAEEGATSITVTVALNVATGSIVQFTLSGSATFGAAMDYTYSSELSGNGPTRLIMIAEGNTTASFTLTAVDDSVDDDDETVTFTVVASGSLAIPTDGSETVTVTITDND